MLVVGDDDIAHDTVGVNPRGGSVERDVGVAEFIGRLSAEVESKGVPEAPGVAHQVIDDASSTAASPPDPL